MTRAMRIGKISRQVSQEVKTAMRLSPLALVALLLVVLLWRSDSAANSGLFQSSPVETPTIAPTTPAVELTPTVPGVGTETPPAPGTATPTTEVTLPAETLTPGPIETVTVQPPLTPEPTLTQEAQTPTPTETGAAETATPEPSPTSEAEVTPDDRARYPEGESNLEFEWGMLFDSVSLFLSYAWLCCGVLIFLAVPVIFIVLWVASKRRQQQEEE
jgi:hypothetical protein